VYFATYIADIESLKMNNWHIINHLYMSQHRPQQSQLSLTHRAFANKVDFVANFLTKALQISTLPLRRSWDYNSAKLFVGKSLFYRATLCIARTMLLQAVCPSVRLFFDMFISYQFNIRSKNFHHLIANVVWYITYDFPLLIHCNRIIFHRFRYMSTYLWIRNYVISNDLEQCFDRM